MMTLSLTLILGMLGLAVDLGWAYYRQQAAQAAADSAAIAAARAALAAAPSGPTCTSAGVKCSATATNCPATAPGSASTNFDNACMLASANGFTTSGIDTVSVTAGTGAVPGVAGPTPTYWATVQVTEALPALFGAAFARGGFTPGAIASAGVFVAASPCVATLGQGLAAGITAAGSAITTHNCDVYVDSDNATAAVTMAGGSISTGTGHTRVVGGVTSAGTTFTPAALTGQPVLSDPYASMQPPTVGACTDGGGISFAGGSNSISQGVYCHVISGAGGTLTMNPGLYVLKAGISLAGTTVTGNGVTLYLLGGGISMAGANVTLSGPTTGTWMGVTIFEDRSDGSAVSLAGVTNTIDGLIYTPDANLSIAGGSGAQTSLICNSFTAAGNFSITGGSAQTNFGSSVSMLQ
jgi:hypothetical protein